MSSWKLTGTVAAVVLGTLAAAAFASSPAQTVSGKLVFATGDGVSDKLEIATVRPDGTAFRKLTHLPAPGIEPRWTTSGRGIVFRTEDSFTGRSANWWMRPDGGGRRRLPGGELESPSPDGKLIQVGVNRIVDARGRMVLRLPFRLRKTDGLADRSVWSPDGRYLAMTVATETAKIESSWILVVRTDGRGSARAVMPRKDGRDASALSWSPDSRRLLVADSRGRKGVWYTIRRDGRGRRRLISVGSESEPDHAWSPDSRRIAYVGRRGVFVVRASGGRPRRLVRTHSQGEAAREVSVDWSSRGELAFSDVGGIYAVRSDGRGLRRITKKRGAPDWSPDGRRLVFEELQEIFVVDRHGAGPRRITRWMWDDTPRWSPDGKHIAFVRGARAVAHPACCGPPESTEIYVMGADGRGVRRIGRGYGPRWSPDGRRLMFVDFAGASGPRSMGGLRAGRIITVQADGSGKREVARGTAPAWAPDGGRIAFMRYSFTQEGLDWAVDESIVLTARADGSDARELFRGSEGTVSRLYEPQWSPDGRTIAIEALDGLRLIDVRTGTIGESLTGAGVNAFEWSPDGSRLAYTQYGAVQIAEVATATRRTLARSGGVHAFPSWSPDGTQVAFIRCTSTGRATACYAYAVDVGGSRPRRLTKTSGFDHAVDWGR